MSPDLVTPSELLGTAGLLAVIVGSGIMGERLAGTNDAIALLANAIATGAGLVVLITIFSPSSGAHFNPAVSLVERLRGRLSTRDTCAYVLAQSVGGLAGIVAAHAMFDLPLLSFSGHARSGPAQWWSEVVASLGLVLTILGSPRDRTPVLVGLYVVAAYWFTASTSFANPAVTIARSLTDTFTGIRPIDVGPFILAQVVGAIAALVVWRALDTPGRRAQSRLARGPPIAFIRWSSMPCERSASTCPTRDRSSSGPSWRRGHRG